MPTIRVPDIRRASVGEEAEEGSAAAFEYQEFEVTSQQAASWNLLNEKEQLTLVLKADREGRDVRDYL